MGDVWDVRTDHGVSVAVVLAKARDGVRGVVMMKTLTFVLLVFSLLGGCCISPFCTGPKERTEAVR